MSKKNKKNDKSISSYDEPIYSLDGTSWEDANWVSSLETLKDYIDVLGVTEALQKRFGLNEEQINMLAEVKDVGNQNRSISLGRKDAQCFRDDPNITQRKLQRYFNEKMKIMFNGKGRHKRTKPSDKEKDPKPWLSHENVYRTHDMLNKQLNIARKSMCGMGTKYVKRFLSERADNGDINAELYKVALEAEEKNIETRHMYMVYDDNETYRQKLKLIHYLMDLCKEHDIVYGYQNDDVKGSYINTVIYFELPEMEQISFHLKMTDKEKKGIPVYDKDWDKKLASTLPKIERTLNKIYETEFIEEREYVKKEKENNDILKEKKRIAKARKKNELNRLKKEIRKGVNGDLSGINMSYIDGVIESEDETNLVRSLRTLKQYLGKFGCTEKLQERFGMAEEQIMMLSKLVDIDMTVDDYRSISIGRDDAALFDNNPDQEELQKLFDKKKDYIIAKREEAPRREKEWENYWDKDDWYDDREYYYNSKPDSYYEALEKNHKLGIDLSIARDNMCGIGTRRLKLFLNRKIKAGDKVAELYRTALEIEDKNITAKQTYYMYKDKVYDQKTALLNDLIALCEDRDDVVYGYQDSDNYSANAILYFELPRMEQISFHTNMSQSEKNKLPKYEKEWDGKVNSTLGKIEKTLSEVYKDEIEKEKEKLKKDNEKKAAKKQKELEEMKKTGK